METWLLLLLGFICISVFCTLLIFGACIVSKKATPPHADGRPLYTRREDDSLTNFERVRAMWRRI